MRLIYTLLLVLCCATNTHRAYGMAIEPEDAEMLRQFCQEYPKAGPCIIGLTIGVPVAYGVYKHKKRCCRPFEKLSDKLFGPHSFLRLHSWCGYSIDTVDADGLTALHRAARDSDMQLAQWCIERDADVNIAAAQGLPYIFHGETPLHFAAQADDGEMLQLLLTNGADAWKRDNFGFPPYNAALVAEKSDAGRVLLRYMQDKLPQATPAEQEAFCTYLNRYGWHFKRALYHAASDHNLQMVKWLIAVDTGTNPDDENDTCDPLEAAIIGLRQNKEDGDEQQGYIPHMARLPAYAHKYDQDYCPVVAELLEHPPDDLSSSLRAACWYGPTSLVHELLERGANPNASDEEGNTALLFALRPRAWGNILNKVKALLAYNAYMRATNRYGLSSVKLALQSDDWAERVVPLLMPKDKPCLDDITVRCALQRLFKCALQRLSVESGKPNPTVEDMQRYLVCLVPHGLDAHVELTPRQLKIHGFWDVELQEEKGSVGYWVIRTLSKINYDNVDHISRELKVQEHVAVLQLLRAAGFGFGKKEHGTTALHEMVTRKGFSTDECEALLWPTRPQRSFDELRHPLERQSRQRVKALFLCNNRLGKHKLPRDLLFKIIAFLPTDIFNAALLKKCLPHVTPELMPHYVAQCGTELLQEVTQDSPDFVNVNEILIGQDEVAHQLCAVMNDKKQTAYAVYIESQRFDNPRVERLLCPTTSKLIKDDKSPPRYPATSGVASGEE